MRFAVAAVLLAWHAAAVFIAWHAAAAMSRAAAVPATAAVGHACCDSVDRRDDDDDAHCRKCRRYCSGFAAGGMDGAAAAERPFSRRCACDVYAPPCRGRVGHAVGPDQQAAEGRPVDAAGRDWATEGQDADADATPRRTDSAWYANARTMASGCSITAVVFAVIVYAGVLEPRDYSNFAKHYAFWLLVMVTLTLTDDLETVTRGHDTEFGYLKLFTICITNNLQIMMSYEIYCFLKSIQEINVYYSQMFRDNLYYHTLCYGGAIAVTGICYFIEINGLLPSNAYFNSNNVKILNLFHLFPGFINICFTLVVFYYTSNLKTRYVCNYHQDISRMYNEKLLIRKQLFGLVGTLWLIDVICVTVQFFGMNYSVLQDLKALQGMGTFIILVFKRSIMDQIKKWILAQTCGVRPNAL